MGDVGDLLELLHGAADRWTTVQTTVRVRGSAEQATQLWIAKPHRWRQEDADSVAVGRGRLWWASSPDVGFMSNEDDADFGFGEPMQSFGAHLDPAQLIPLLSFTQIEHGRGVVVAHVRPRGGQGFSVGMPRDGDEHVLTIDGERGVVLRIETLIGGEPFSVSELEGTIWDAAIPDDVFELTPSPGERVRSPRELHRVVTFEEAAQFAPFPVFAIAELPHGQWRSRVHFTAAGGTHPESVYVTYHRADARGVITLFEQPADVPERRRGHDRPTQVVVVRAGTRITISSDTYDENRLRELVGKLERV
jgi:hypothetical protein